MIRTRASKDDFIYGSGPTTISLTDDELDLMAALLCHVRLGNQRKYGAAAFKLLETLADAYGGDVVDAGVLDRVQIIAEIQDSGGEPLMEVPGDSLVIVTA